MEDAREWGRWWRIQGLAEMRDVLWDSWDPLGVADHEDWPRDEYDSYATVLAGKLRRSNSRSDIAFYLATAFAPRSPPTKAASRLGEVAADALIAWYSGSGAPGSSSRAD